LSASVWVEMQCLEFDGNTLWVEMECLEFDGNTLWVEKECLEVIDITAFEECFGLCHRVMRNVSGC